VIVEERIKRKSRWWPWFFGLCFLEGLASFAWLLLIPTDSKNQALFGYSANRLAMMGLIFLLSMGFLLLGLLSLRNENWRSKWLNPGMNRGMFNAVMILGAVIALVSWGTLFYLRLYPEAKYLAYYERFLPLLGWLVLVGFQAAIWIAILKWGVHWGNFNQEDGSFWQPFGIIAGAFLVIWLFIAYTGIGITVDAVAWNTPGVPVSEWHIWLAWIAGVCMLAAGLNRKVIPQKGWKPTAFDVLMALVLWGLAVGVWMRQPVPYTFFTPKPIAPNFEVYPYSDAANHDIVAQHILVGNGFMGDQVTKRPLLSVFLAGLHTAAGQDYDQMILLQTLFLAMFPVVLYFLGKAMHSRALGVMLGLLSLLRELNIIGASPYSRVSHSKMLMSDIPAAIGIALFSLLVILWLRNPSRRRLMPLAAGGVMGLLMLVRTQSVLLVFFAMAAALAAYGWRWKRWLQGCLLLCAGILVAIIPWVGRNYAVTGRVVFDQTEQTGIFAQRYTDLPGYSMPARDPGESEEAYTHRMVADTWSYTISHPGAVAGFVSAHFLNNEINTVLVMPLRDAFYDLDDVFRVTRSFWDDWDGVGNWMEGLKLALTLVLIAVGIAGSFRRWGAAGLIPLLMNVAYSLSNALVRNSGGRYILPVDWIGYVYFAIGLLEVSLGILLLFGLRPEKIIRVLTRQREEVDEHKSSGLIWKGSLLGLLFFGLGSLLPLSEILFPVQFPDPSKEQVASRLLTMESAHGAGLNLDMIAEFLAEDATVVVEGRALYPRYYGAGEGEPGAGWSIYNLQDYARMGFLLVGPSPQKVVIRLDEPPDYFPNASDVILVGCQTESFLDLALVAVLGDKEITYLRSGEPVYSCKR
jgi:hypothetical protein